jgi:hypothetical protein
MDGQGSSFECPRCGRGVTERFYGPCSACRSALRADLGGAQREADLAGFEPKMNVVPNQIATKD